MADNYPEAAVRHFRDSELLAGASRWGNAGHLVGFAAECAVKHKIQSLRPSGGAPHGHFPDLIVIARKHLRGRRDTELCAVLKTGALMHNWGVNDRYGADALVGKAEYDTWRRHAVRLMSAAGIKR